MTPTFEKSCPPLDRTKLRRLVRALSVALPDSSDALQTALRMLAVGAMHARGIAADSHWRNLIESPPAELQLFSERIKLASSTLGSAWKMVQTAAKENTRLLCHRDFLPWCYQALRSEDKQTAQAKLKASPEARMARDDISPATLLYTEAYMVEFLLDHCLQPVLTTDDGPTVFDPACGAGVFLLGAFDRLVLQFSSPTRRQLDSVLTRQLCGTDIDATAIAVAQTALWLRAAELDPGCKPPSQLFALQHPFGSLGATGELGVASDQFANQHDVVLANPPYLSAAHMSEDWKRHLATHFPEGKRDLYTAFIQRCLALTKTNGRCGIVAQHAWMFLKQFTALRQRILSEVTFHTVAHLGTGAFADIGGEVVNVAMIVMQPTIPQADHCVTTVRASGGRSVAEKAKMLHDLQNANSQLRQADLLKLPRAAMCNWLDPHFVTMMQGERLCDVAEVKQGLRTTDNHRFVRRQWETPADGERWFAYSKGGGYQKWCGLQQFVVDFENDGAEIAQLATTKYPYLKGKTDWVIGSRERYFQPGLTFTCNARGSLGVRQLPEGSIFDPKGPGIFLKQDNKEDNKTDGKIAISFAALTAILNTRVTSYLLRAVCPVMDFNPGYLADCPLPPRSYWKEFASYGEACTRLKLALTRGDLLEPEYQAILPSELKIRLQMLLLTCEGGLENVSSQAWELGRSQITALDDELGLAAGCQPLLEGYDQPPGDCYGEEQTVSASLAHVPRKQMTAAQLQELKSQLALGVDSKPPPAKFGRALPVECDLEAWSRRLRIHPLSLWRLLTEDDSWRTACHAMLSNETADRITEFLIQYVGSQPNGILVISDSKTLDDLTDALDSKVANFASALGEPWREWLTKRFFRHHLKQFCKRPLLWQLQSARTPKKLPEFVCLLSFRSLSEGMLTSLLSTVKDLPETPGKIQFAKQLGKLTDAGWRFTPSIGVRKAIAPFQAAGLLAAPVLSKADLKKALETQD